MKFSGMVAFLWEGLKFETRLEQELPDHPLVKGETIRYKSNRLILRP